MVSSVGARSRVTVGPVEHVPNGRGEAGLGREKGCGSWETDAQ